MINLYLVQLNTTDASGKIYTLAEDAESAYLLALKGLNKWIPKHKAMRSVTLIASCAECPACGTRLAIPKGVI